MNNAIINVEKLVNDFCAAMERNEWEYSYDVVRDIVRTSVERKWHNIELLAKHPNWNPDECAVIVNKDYTREFKKDAIWEFVNWLEVNLGENTTVATEINRIIYYENIRFKK